MHILVVEDERIIAERLVRLLTEILGGQLQSLEVKPTLTQAKGYLEHTRIDLLFLDLNLKGKNGFDLLEGALAEPFETVIVSAHTERAMEAFEYGVLDFVGKPFDRARLEVSIDRYLGRQSNARNTRFLSVKLAAGTILICLDEVAYIRGAGPYAELILRDGKTHLHSKSLDKLAQSLPKHWQRIHKSYVANLSEVKNWRAFPGSKYELELQDGTKLPVGRTRYKALRSQWV